MLSNVNYTPSNITFINLRDIRFSQYRITEPASSLSNGEFEHTFDSYPVKFYNYMNNDLIVLGMFGQNNYYDNPGIDYGHTPIVPCLRVVKFPPSMGNCFVSVDNRRLYLLYRQLCFLMSESYDEINSKCKPTQFSFKNTIDFLEEIKLSSNVNIYVPCVVVPYNYKDRVSTIITRSYSPNNTYEAVINTRVAPPSNIDQRSPLNVFLRDNYTEGYQIFPFSDNSAVNIETFLRKKYMDNVILSNNDRFKCRNANDPNVSIRLRYNINTFLRANGINIPIHPTPQSLGIYYDSDQIRHLYSKVANLFIHFMTNPSQNIDFKNIPKYISFNDLYNNQIKFLPNFQEWQSKILSNISRKSKISISIPTQDDIEIGSPTQGVMTPTRTPTVMTPTRTPTVTTPTRTQTRTIMKPPSISPSNKETNRSKISSYQNNPNIPKKFMQKSKKNTLKGGIRTSKNYLKKTKRNKRSKRRKTRRH